MREIKYNPIGLVRSPFKDIEGMPIQPTSAQGARGTVEVFAEYCAGLKDIGGFSHIILIYHFHLSKGCSLEVKPFLDEEARGVFATRGPARPNPIGISVVRLVEVEGCTLHIEDVDIVRRHSATGHQTLCTRFRLANSGARGVAVWQIEECPPEEIRRTVRP